jgi:hypothetical protein
MVLSLESGKNLTENMFPWCPLWRVFNFLYENGSHIMICTSSEPLANRLLSQSIQL